MRSRKAIIVILSVLIALACISELAFGASADSATPEAQPSQCTVVEGAEKVQAAATHHEEEHEHGLPQSAVEIARPFGFPITNSMFVSWVVALALIVFAQVATRHMKRVPDGAQNFWEWLVESLSGFLEGIIGK